MSQELVNTEGREVSVLDSLAMEAQTLRMNIDLNMWQLARVFTQAKEIVPHGQFGKWVEENASVSERTAQDMMAAYKRFGDNPQFADISKAKAFKLLPLPAGTEEKFLQEHDVSSMTTREVQEAVRQEREKAQKEIESERLARIAAEQRAKEAENRPPKIPEDISRKLEANKETIARLRALNESLASAKSDNAEELRRLTMENAALQRDLRDRDDVLAEQQEDLNRAQQELLNMQSAIAKGDAERAPADQLTLDAFASAVRAFVGTCARMPSMRSIFAAMDQVEKQEYDLLLKTVEKWAEDSRRAIETTYIDAEVSDYE